MDTMYRVQGTMRDNYYADEEPPRRTNLVSVGVDCNSSSQEEVLMNNAGLITLLGCVKVIQINLRLVPRCSVLCTSHKVSMIFLSGGTQSHRQQQAHDQHPAAWR